MKSIKQQNTFVYLSVAMYLAGIIGLSIEPSQTLFRFLTPFHLLSSVAMLFYFQEEKSKPFYYAFLFLFIVGYFIEVLGVKTGMIFGEYYYLTTLGFKILDVPPMIGVNWFLLVFSTVVVIDKITQEKLQNFSKAVLGALFLTALDFLVEPVAITHKMWEWEKIVPPAQNYIAWYAVSFIMCWVVFSLKFKKHNFIAPYILALQTLFFVVLRVVG